MGERGLAENIKRQQYFKAVESPVPEHDEGTREIGELYPFLISGGSNTERFYFTHVNNITEYKFNIRPEYFGNESSYTDVFPKRIKEILNANHDARVFCVFDWDTVYGNEARLESHRRFEDQFRTEISEGRVTLCPSMPCIEYWFLLHFVDYSKFLRNYSSVSNRLAPYMKRQCFPGEKQVLGKLLKMGKYLKSSTWVERLCADGKLDLAKERAENNITAALSAENLDAQSYSYVYKAFKKRKLV